MYIGVEPIELNTLIPTDDTEARERHQKLLNEASDIGGTDFPIWNAEEHAKMMFYTQPLDRAEERKVFGEHWKRIKDCSISPGLMSEKILPSAIFGERKLHMATLCAIIGIANHDMKFSTTFLEQAIYPNKNNKPLYNNYGKYGIRLFVNGAQRLITVDDYLLWNAKSRRLGCCTYERDENEFALAMIEKAYMQLYQRAFFTLEPNASIDMHLFTSWIPETVHFDDVSNKENLWNRLVQNFRDQNIILAIQNEDEQEMYSVLDLIEEPIESNQEEEPATLKILQCKTPYKNNSALQQFILYEA